MNTQMYMYYFYQIFKILTQLLFNNPYKLDNFITHIVSKDENMIKTTLSILHCYNDL